MRVLVLVALVVIGCKNPPPPRSSTTDAGPIRSLAFHASGVRFEGEDLDLCFDFDVSEVTLARDAAANDGSTVGEVEDQMVGALLDVTKATKLRSSSTCTEQFPDKVVLGTCTRTFPNKVVVAVHRYRFETVFGSDAAMKECLTEDEGTWRATPRDSDALRRAEKEDAVRAARQKARRP